MPMAFEAAVVTASVAQVPSIRRSTGFSLIMPFVNSSLRLFACYAPSFTVLYFVMASLTAFVTARLVMDAPVMASISPSDGALFFTSVMPFSGAVCLTDP